MKTLTVLAYPPTFGSGGSVTATIEKARLSIQFVVTLQYAKVALFVRANALGEELL